MKALFYYCFGVFLLNISVFAVYIGNFNLFTKNSNKFFRILMFCFIEEPPLITSAFIVNEKSIRIKWTHKNEKTLSRYRILYKEKLNSLSNISEEFNEWPGFYT